MKVEICSSKDKDQGYFIRMAQSAGYEVTEYKGRYWVEVYKEWSMPCPEFDAIESGTYMFRKNNEE